jgi:hypothetical protein
VLITQQKPLRGLPQVFHVHGNDETRQMLRKQLRRAQHL